LRRGFDPGAGLWTFPGGFVDLGESVEDAARREAHEELEIDVAITGLVGVYSRPEDRVVLVVYDATLTGEPRVTPEATEVRAFAPEDVPWDELAFWSTEQALRDLLARA
jgi:ADP-ribose pyrophosphatase YjhB (NUDIX family)